MTYPLINDYKAAMRNPTARFASLTVDPATTSKGQPVFLAGNFACVFKGRLNGAETPSAIKCFIRDMPDLERRHAAIADIIKSLDAPYLPDLAFHPGELFVSSEVADSGDYPVVTMPWIEGETLSATVKRLCEGARRDALVGLGRAWANLCLNMLSAGISHGDLKHDNILIDKSGKLMLIDCESIYTPALNGLPAILLGGVNYQHPKREAKHFDGDLDHFSMLVIALTLRALAFEPGLLEKHCNGENLILTREDFNAPDRSELIARLKSSPDGLIREWTDQMVEALAGESMAIPKIKRTLKQAKLAEAEPVEGRWAMMTASVELPWKKKKG